MIDLAAYDLRPLSERLRRIRDSKDFRERQALLEAVDMHGAAVKEGECMRVTGLIPPRKGWAG